MVGFSILHCEINVVVNIFPVRIEIRRVFYSQESLSLASLSRRYIE